MQKPVAQVALPPHPWQVWPCEPQATVEVPAWQSPLVSQQPAQFEGLQGSTVTWPQAVRARSATSLSRVRIGCLTPRWGAERKPRAGADQNDALAFREVPCVQATLEHALST